MEVPLACARLSVEPGLGEAPSRRTAFDSLEVEQRKCVMEDWNSDKTEEGEEKKKSRSETSRSPRERLTGSDASCGLFVDFDVVVAVAN